MANVKLRSYLKELHGRTGNYVFYNVKGRQYVRSYAKPRNPKSAAQQKNRSTFAEAVKLWQVLSPEEKKIYKKIAKNMPCSGYNLFISIQIRGKSSGEKKSDKCEYLQNRLLNSPNIKAGNSVSKPYMDWIGTAYGHKPCILLNIPEIPVTIPV